MNWDEKADDHAVAHHTYEHMPPAVNAKIYMGFVLGARWQREQVRTNEAVERLANFLFEDDNGESIDQHEKICHDVSKCRVRSDYKQFARAAITALLGEKP